MTRAAKLTAALLAALAVWFFPTPPARAASTLRFQAVRILGPDGKPRGRVYAGGQSIFTLAGRGERSVADAQEVARRLNALAEAGLRAPEISLRRARGRSIIVARGERVLGVDRRMARAHHSDPDRLARAWAENLRRAFARPYLSLPALVTPLGEARSARLLGNIAGEVKVRVEGPVASAEWIPETGSVRVLGHAVGETTLEVSDRASVLRVPLSVKKYAARWIPLPAAEVTGDPAPAEAVARAVKACAAASMVLEPGAWGRVTPIAEGLRPLARGKTTRVPVFMAAAGDRYLARRRREQVVVRNESVDLPPAEMLMVSNWPEKLTSHGLWFEGRLHEGETIRLLYHHVNATGAKADLVVELWNLGDETARVHVIEGIGGPSYDEAWAGHRAAKKFLQNQTAGVGWVAPVPVGRAAPIVAQTMPKGTVASGVLELRELSGGAVSVRIYLAPHSPERLPRAIDDYRESPLLGQWHYAKPRREVKARYEVGGPWAFVTIGRNPSSGLVEGDELRGNYGVIYDIELELVNPTAEEARVALTMEPAGGVARASVVIDGRLVEAAMLRRGVEVRLAEYRLAPGEVRRIGLKTMPQSGSNYPVRLAVRPE